MITQISYLREVVENGKRITRHIFGTFEHGMIVSVPEGEQIKPLSEFDFDFRDAEIVIFIRPAMYKGKVVYAILDIQWVDETKNEILPPSRITIEDVPVDTLRSYKVSRVYNQTHLESPYFAALG